MHESLQEWLFLAKLDSTAFLRWQLPLHRLIPLLVRGTRDCCYLRPAVASDRKRCSAESRAQTIPERLYVPSHTGQCAHRSFETLRMTRHEPLHLLDVRQDSQQSSF